MNYCLYSGQCVCMLSSDSVCTVVRPSRQCVCILYSVQCACMLSSRQCVYSVQCVCMLYIDSGQCVCVLSSDSVCTVVRPSVYSCCPVTVCVQWSVCMHFVQWSVCLHVVQCRKYKASEKVRRRADVIYYKFKKLFTIKDGDDFTKVLTQFVLTSASVKCLQK